MRILGFLLLGFLLSGIPVKAQETYTTRKQKKAKEKTSEEKKVRFSDYMRGTHGILILHLDLLIRPQMSDWKHAGIFGHIRFFPIVLELKKTVRGGGLIM